ncbi:pseudouridine synthase [Rhodoluna limnophila]|uniref:pseudouridine synthase n=1 Tax=Rhodoluna limnophila TaxID=232537 RepID=UPI001105DC15|nr:pseudouridine synthase [Rhodoluna limnophila]
MTNFNDEPEGVRLQKVMAAAGVASRRVCEDFITQGRVKVNGKVVTELGTRINPEVDKVTVGGTPIQLDNSRVYLALNKPRGVVSTMADENGRPDLTQFVIGYDRVFNVGRLDSETTGLIIMTNDGDLAHKLAHPKFGVTKTYVARVEGVVTPAIIHKLFSGFELEDGFIKADKAHIVDVQPEESLVEIVLHSGRNRIVRRMFDFVGHPVVGLVRRQFGPIQLGPLKEGRVRELSKIEVGALLKAAEGKQERAPRPPKGQKAAPRQKRR